VAEPVLFVSLDTEADDQWTAEGRRRLAVRNAECLPRLQALCDRYGIPPIYLTTHEMASKPESAAVLQSLAATGRCEIGAHLHPWSSPPYRPEDLVGRYPRELPDDLLERQMRELTDAIAAHLGVRPRSYRAGRLGVDERNLQHLETLGYVVDTSVDPLFNERRLGGRAFPGARLTPYHPDRANLLRRGASPLLEIPISSATLPRLPKPIEAAYALLPPLHFRPALKRLGLRPVWLRPSFSSAEDSIALAESLVARGVPTLNMVFHSSELLPGGSPYYKSAAAVDGFYDTFERVVDHLVTRLHARPMTYLAYAERAMTHTRHET
jgi:peptidoglycan/xylan/chitin deacetylase (PgdA/CDA1 family)